jgi:hypothetical protein
MRTLLLATATMFAISCGAALAASNGGGAGAGGGTGGGGNSGCAGGTGGSRSTSWRGGKLRPVWYHGTRARPGVWDRPDRKRRKPNAESRIRKCFVATWRLA